MTSNREILGIYCRLAKLTEIKQRSKDRMKPLIQYSLKLLQYKTAKIFIFIIVCVHLFGMLITIHTLLEDFGKRTFFQYGAFCGLHTVFWLALGTLLLINDEWVDFLWKYGKSGFPIELMDEIKLKKVSVTMKILKLTVIITVCFSILTPFGFIQLSDYMNRKSYFCVWIRKNFPNSCELILSLYNCTHFVSALFFIAVIVCFVYATFTAMYQIYVLKCMIIDIPRTCIPKKYRRDSELYQEVLRQKMIMVIRTHEFIVGYQTRFTKILSTSISVTYIIIYLVAGSIMIELISNQGEKFIVKWQFYLGFIGYIICAVISSTVIFTGGEVLKDSTDDCAYELCQLPWYDMNPKNKRIYSLFLYRIQRKLNLSNRLMEVDFMLLLKILKNLYSLAAILRQIIPTDVQN